MLRRFAILAFILAVPASAQVSGCARDSNGALQCGVRSSPGEARTVVPTSNPARRPVQANAAARQAAALEAERERREAEQRQAGERRGAERRNCIARAGNNIAALGACPL